MTYSLLWIEGMIAALLWCAAWRTAARRPWAPIARIAASAAALLPVLVGLAGLTASVMLMQEHVAGNGIWFTASWLVGLLAGTTYIWRRTSRSRSHSRDEAWTLGWLAPSAAAALALAVITFWIIDSRMRSQLALVRAEATALAMSTAPPRVPDVENAALIYEQAIENLQWEVDGNVLPEAVDDWFDNPASPFPADNAELNATLDQNVTTLALLHRAAQRPHCFFERDYSRLGINTPMPEVTRLMTFARLLQLDAGRELHRGNCLNAARDVRTMMAMSAHLLPEPILISQLVSAALLGRAFDMIPLVLAHPALDAGSVAMLDPADHHATMRHSMQRAMLGEEAFGLSVFAALGDGETTYNELVGTISFDGAGPGLMDSIRRALQQLVTPLWRVLLMGDDLNGYRQWMATQRNIGAEPFHTEGTQRRMEEAKRAEESINSAAPGVLTMAVAPAISSMHVTVARTDAQYRLIILAVAMARYQQANDGALPQSLADLVPDHLIANPIDPFDGRALRFVPLENGGFRIYSVGPNRTDDGGMTNADNRDEGDVVMTVTRG